MAASITNNADVDIVAEAATGLQAPVEKRMNDSDDIPETIDEKTEIDEPAEADGVVHPEGVAKVEDQQSQQADMMDSDVVLEEIKCEETYQQEEKPKSEAHEPTIDAQGVLNQESAEETDDPMNEKIEETARDVAAPKETTLEHEATISALPVNTQVQSQESLEETEDTEAEIQPSSGFGDAYPEDQSNLGVTIDNDTVNEDTLRGIEKQDDGQQDEDLEPEKATENTQPASMTNIPHVEIVTGEPSGVQTPGEPNLDNSDAVPDTIDANTETDEPAKAHAVVHLDKKGEAPSGVQTPGEPNLDNSDAVPDTIDANIETDDPAKAHAVVHLDKKESFPEDTSTPEPTEEVVKVDDQESQKADEMDANMVQEEVPKSEHADEPATDALEVLNQESAEEIDAPVNTEETAHQSNMPASVETTPEYDVTSEPPASIANIPDVEVITEASSGIQTPVEINLDTFDAIPDTTNGNTETDEPAKANTVVHPDKKESFPEDTSTTEPTEEVVKLEDQHNQQADALDEEVVQEEEPKSEHTDEPATDAVEALNPESAEETDGPVDENTEETAHQSNMPASEETTPKYDTATWELPVTIQAQNLESLEEREVVEAVDTEAIVQQSSVAFEEAVPEDQHNLGATNTTVQEDTLKATGQTKEDQQYQDLGPESATETTEPESTADIPDVEVITEAPSGIQTPVEINLDISDAIPDTIDGNTETDEPSKAHVVVHLDKKESFPEDTSTAGPESEHANEPATDALEVLNQESAEKTDGPVNENTEETAHQSNMPACEETTQEYDATTREPPVTIQAQNLESLEETEATVEEREVAEAVATEAPVQQSSVAFEDAVPEDQHDLGATNNTLQEDTEEAIGQTKDGQQYNLGSENATVNTQPESMENIPDVEVITEAPSGIQTPVEINLDISDAIPDTTDGNTEADELVEPEGVIHAEMKESFPEDTSTAEPTEEVAKVDQQSQQADAMVADVVQEEVPKSEHDDEPGVSAQGVLNQESAEETDGLMNVNTEETEHKSNMVVPEDTMPEHDAQMGGPPVNIQEQSQESVGDAEAVDTEAKMQQSSVAFEETTPENHVAITESCSEIQHVHHMEPEEINGPGDPRDDESTNMSNTENLLQDNILPSGPTIDIQPVQELEQIEMDEASNQTHAVVFNDLAQEDATKTSEPQVIEKEELKDIEATEAEEITKLDHVTPSKDLAVENDSTVDEPHNGEIHQTSEQDLVEVKDTETYHEKTISTSEDTVEDNVTADEPSCGSQEVVNAESTEETKQNTAENIAEVPDVIIDDEAIEQDVLETDDVTEMRERELEPEEMKSTEPVESEEAYDLRNDALFDNSAQEDNIHESEMEQTESVTEIKEIEPTEVEAVPRESNACVSDELSQDYIKESETSCDNQQVNITESSEVIDGHKDIITGGISGQRNTASAGDSAEESSVPEGEPPADIQAVQELGSEEIKNTQIDEVNEPSLEMDATVIQTPTQEENPATTELHESTEVSNIEAIEVHRNPHESDAAAQSEEQATEEIASGLKPESIEDNDTEANEPQSTSQEKIIYTSEDSVPEEIATEDNIITEPDVDHQQLHDQESAEIKGTEADKSQEIAPSNTLSSEESTSEDNVTSTEPSSDTQAENSQLAEETEDSENVKSNTALAEAAAPETDATADTSSFHEADLEETKDTGPIETEDVMTSSDYTSEKMGMETMETEAVPDESNVAKEHIEDNTSTPNAPHDGTEPVCELESVEDRTDTTEHPRETHGSTSDELTPTEEDTTVTEPSFNTQEVQNLTSQEMKDSEDDKTDEFSDISSFPTPGEVDQVPRTRIGPTPDVQEMQELGLTEESRDIEAMEPEDHQEHIVSTLEKPAVDGEPNADDQQVHEDKVPEVEDNKTIEADEDSKQSNIATPDNAAEERNELGLTEESRDVEAMEPEDHQERIVSTLEKPAVDGEPNANDQEVHEDKVPEVEDNKAIEADEDSKKSNIATPDNAAEERNELESDLDSYAQPTQQVELSKDNENSQLVKAVETSGQSNSVTLEERTTEYSVTSETDPPVDIKQEPPVEEIKSVDATEAEEDFHTSGSDAIEKLASESNIATIEPTYNIQQVDVLEATKEKKNAEAINDGEQSNIAVSEEPTITDNGATPKDHHVESNEGTIGNETDNVILAHGIKDEIQKSAQLKDDACDLGETVLTTQRSENKTDEDAVTSGNDLETSNNIHQVKEEPNAGTEHNSSQMSSERNGENTTHVKDRDVEGQVLTESDTAEASQALFENDPQAAQDTTQKDDITKGSEQTSDHDSKQHGDVALQQQSCETDVLSIEKQDEALQKIDSDQKEKEDEEIESQNDELQVGEQKHEDKRDDLTTEPLVEYQNFENAATNRTEDNDAFEVEQTEAAISVILKNEKALHISKKTSEGTEEDDDAKNYNKDEKETAENDDIVAKSSTNERSETTDEIRNEELKSGLASSVQEASDPAPSKDKILKNDPVHVVQASEKEITDEIEESKEIHDDNAICHDELQTNSEKEESPQLRSNEQYNVDAKIDDTTPLCEEKVHENASIKPREIKNRGENEGLDSTSEPSIESSIQNNVEDSSSHHKVEDEKLSVSEKNDVDTEVMEEKNDESATDINQTEQCQEEINADDVLQLETEKYSVDKIEETASHEETKTSSTAAIEAVMINEDITDKVTGADGAPSNESFKTFTDTGRDLDVSLVITTSKEDRVNDNMENLNLDHPGHPAQDGNTHEKVLSLEETEREMPSSEKLLQTESGENQIPNEQDEKDIQDEHQTPKEKNEEDMQDTEIGEAKKEVEQELPVSHFLMNLILGKESSDANEDSESEAARKQGEATEDGSCTFISKQEESLGSLPTEDKVDDNLTFVEQEKHEVKCSEETQEMVKEQIDDLKLDTERSIETDEDIKKNTHNLEIPAYQDNPQDEISGELLTGEAADVSTKMETRDINILSVELDDRAVGTVCQENMEVSIKNENGSLRSSLNDSTNTKAPEEDTLGEGQTGLVLESLPEDISFDAVSKQAPLLTESGMTDANDWSRDTAGVQNPVSAKQDKPTESANVEATCSTDIQLENEEVDKKEEEQHANTDIDEVSEENVESSHVNLQKITSSEVTSSELATQITEPVCDTQTILAHEKEISEENFPTAYEIQADGPSLQIDQAKQDEAADNESAMEPEKLVESNFQEHQEIGIEQKSPEETDEGDQQLLAKKEILTQEQDVHETVESPQQAFESPQKTVSIKSNEDQELFDSKFQECDLNVVSPREASEAEENFVEVTKPEFSTDEEQSPKAADAEEKIHDEKIKDIEGTKNFTDEAAVKTEAPGAAQKAHKKQGLLSGVGSKVKHQLAKVKKAIVGKPGRTKPESPKA